MSSKIDLILSSDLVESHSELESDFRVGCSKMKEGVNEMALSLYGIQQGGTWRVAKDDHGEMFQTWEHYIRWLGDDVGIGRSTIFDYKGIVNFALTNGLVEDEDGFTEKGGVMSFRIVKRSTITDRSGRIVGIKGMNTDDPVSVAQEIVDVMDPDLRPMDKVKLIQDIVSKGADVVDIFFRLRASKEGGHELIWLKESSAGHEEGLVRYTAPEDVLSVLKSKFHILE